MRLIVTGANGQLGYEVAREAQTRGHFVKGIDIRDLDITDDARVRAYFCENAADALVHCAAYTAVDKAEDDRETCMRVNADGTRNLARACAANGMKMIYISTDYVFDGSGNRPWRADDIPGRPVNAYGESKLAGETAVKECLTAYFIVRSSWIFGAHGNNFAKTMLRLGRERGSVRVVNDQIGAPTYARDLAKLLTDMAQSEAYGVYHAVNEGECSFYEYAREIFRQSGVRADVTPISSGEYASRAARPLNSRLDTSKLAENGFQKLPDWRGALRRYLTEISEA